jgi:hypothetical protein
MLKLEFNLHAFQFSLIDVIHTVEGGMGIPVFEILIVRNKFCRIMYYNIVLLCIVHYLKYTVCLHR